MLQSRDILDETNPPTTHATNPVLQVVAAALVQTDDDGRCRVLAARRAPGRRHAGCWELPGGQIEPGETEQNALSREIQEELSVKIRLEQRLGDATVPAGAHAIHMAVWLAEIVEGEPALIDHDAIRWLVPEEFRTLTWGPADIPHLARLRAAMVTREAASDR